MGRDFIYARVSTNDQEAESQIERLKEDYKEALIVSEVQSTRRERHGLKSLLAQLQPGDRVIVYSLDRLCRSVKEMLEIMDVLAEKKVTLITRREGEINQETPTGKLYIQIMAAMAEFERSIISERTKSALAYKRAQGMKLGRRPSITQETWDKMERLVEIEGKTLTDAAKEVGISKSAASKYLNKKAY